LSDGVGRRSARSVIRRGRAIMMGAARPEEATCGRIVHVGGGGRKHSQDTVTRIPCPVRKRQRERIRQGKRIRPDSGKLGCTGESHRLGGCNDVSSHVIVVVAPGMICAARGSVNRSRLLTVLFRHQLRTARGGQHTRQSDHRPCSSSKQESAI
jgi:hypothetical protein